jgi:hypothetical protein
MGPFPCNPPKYLKLSKQRRRETRRHAGKHYIGSQNNAIPGTIGAQYAGPETHLWLYFSTIRQHHGQAKKQ